MEKYTCDKMMNKCFVINEKNIGIIESGTAPIFLIPTSDFIHTIHNDIL